MAYDNFEPVERQPYRAEITDQGTSETRNGTPVVKVYARILGKPGAADPDQLIDPIVGFRPEVEVSVFLDPNDQYCGFRARDLVENLGWNPDLGIESLDPRTPNYLNVVGKKITVSAAFRGDKTYWNFCRAEKKLKRFTGTAPVENLKAKSGGVADAYKRLKEKKNDGVPQGATAATGETVPF